MVNPNINTLTDIFLPDGYGSFGFGDGGYGGEAELLNPQWNTNSGNFGIDPVSGLAYVEATSTPSYVGASIYTIENSSFFAKIVPASAGTGSVQTSLIIKNNARNYVEMSLGQNNQFLGYVSDNQNVTLPDSPFPAYDPVAHAYWRIRNNFSISFSFDTSPDGFTWTELATVPYAWDASSVVVTIFAGFTGLDSPGNIALISNINLPGNTLQLSSTSYSTASANGVALVSDPNALSANANGLGGARASFLATVGIPEGGLTDFAWAGLSQVIDPMIYAYWSDISAVFFTGSSPVTQSSWQNNSFPVSVPSAYRDGSYWQPAAYASLQYIGSRITDNAPNLVTNVQTEKSSGLNNRLSTNAFIYSDSCLYTPGFGLTSMTQSTDQPLTGQYSGKMLSNTSPLTAVNGDLIYLPLPNRQAMTPVIQSSSGRVEDLFGTVSFSTQRANTVWYASFIFYDANFNILSDSTYQHASITNKNTHPGGGIWQTGAVVDITHAISSSAAWVSIVPVVVVPNTSTIETTYASNHSITGASLFFTESGTPYSDPRTANVNIKADRVNYALNSGFNTGISQWIQRNTNTTGTPNPVTAVWDSTVGYNSLGSMKVAVAAPSGTFSGSDSSKLGTSTVPNFSSVTSRQPVVQGLKSNHTYTISAWIKRGPNCPDVYMDFVDSNGQGVIGVSVNNIKSTSPENIDGTWTRIQTTYTVPPMGLQDYGFYFYNKFLDITHAPYNFWLDSILVEESTTYEGYFDGGYASVDYKWEANGIPNLTRSYYYKDYANKFLNLNNSIKSVLPVGESYNLLFAQPIT